MIITVAQQKEMAWFDIDRQIQKLEQKAKNHIKRQAIKTTAEKYISLGMDPEVAKVLAKADVEMNIVRFA